MRGSEVRGGEGGEWLLACYPFSAAPWFPSPPAPSSLTAFAPPEGRRGGKEGQGGKGRTRGRNILRERFSSVVN